jgi:hypothetical protein
MQPFSRAPQETGGSHDLPYRTSQTYTHIHQSILRFHKPIRFFCRPNTAHESIIFVHYSMVHYFGFVIWLKRKRKKGKKENTQALFLLCHCPSPMDACSPRYARCRTSFFCPLNLETPPPSSCFENGLKTRHLPMVFPSHI